MRLTFCVACGATDDLQHHHLVTRAEGGSNDPSNLITLCSGCHFKLHGRQQNGAYNYAQHVRAGQQAAKARGVKLGRKPKLTHHQRLEAIARRDAGETVASIARSYNVHHSMIVRL
jgi:hypothetical protein